MAIEELRSEPSRYLEGEFAPIHDEISAEDLPVIGELPTDLAGSFVRTGSNPYFTPPGRYHWFDGDGMLHAAAVGDGRVDYRNRFVQTEGLEADLAAGEALRSGINEQPDIAHPNGPYKDTSNTDLVWHNDRLLSLWWLSGKARPIRLPDLETCGIEDFGGTYNGNIAAHAKVDPATGEMVFIDYQPFPPFLTYGVIAPDGTLAHLEPIDLPGPRLQHDIAFTQNNTLLFDMSMMWDPDLLAQGQVRLGFFRDSPSRIGVIPRRGANADVRWFEVEPMFMYHTIAAWEEGDEVVLTGCRITHPFVNDPDNPPVGLVPELEPLRLEPYLYEWRMNLVTGRVSERQLDDRITEFPRCDDRQLGQKMRWSYNPIVARDKSLLFDGVIAYDLETGGKESYSYPDGWFGGEVSFCPAVDAKAENDGYLLTFAAERSTGASELYVMDARRVADGPVARVPIPHRVPIGYHTRWVPAAGIASQSI